MTPSEAIADIRAQAAQLDLASTNEAATRIVIINRVLHEVLGWPLSEFNPESPHEGQGSASDWLDYELRSGVGRLVVEAKKIGSTFHFSTDRRQPIYKLSTLRRNHGQELRDALAQALRYCGSANTPFFVVTNGQQWIVGISFWPGVEGSELSALAFHDLEDIEARLDKFVDLISPHGVEVHAAVGELIKSVDHAPVFAASLNDRLYNNGPAHLNYLSAPIATVMREYFGRLVDNVDDAEFVEHCYVTSELAEGYVRRLSLYTGNTKPDTLRDATKIDRQRVAKDIPSGRATEFLRSGDLVIIAGGMGSGKSEFIQYALRRIRASESDWIALAVDLVGRTELIAKFTGEHLRAELCRYMLEQAEAQYPDYDPFKHEVLRGIFAPDIQRAIKSLSPAQREDSARREQVFEEVIGDRKQSAYVHLTNYLSYLARHLKKPVTVFIDNVDRGSSELEHFVFLFGRGIAEATGASVITTMRESTYEAGRRNGFLDVGGYSTFTVAPPSFAMVAKKRFEFARTAVADNAELRRRIQRSLQGYPLERVEDFVSVLFELALGRSHEMGDAIQSLAGPNVRLALELLAGFAVSKNTDIERLLKDYNHERYSHRLATLVRSLMRGDTFRFDESVSSIANVFRASRTVRESHFSCIRVLQFLDSRMEDQDVDVSVGVVVSTVSKVGPTLRSIVRAIEYLGRSGLITSRSHPDQPWPPNATVRVTSSGLFYLRVLIFDREYLSNLADDTVIYDVEVVNSLEDAHRSDGPWHQRYEAKLRLFLRYLADQELAELRRVTQNAAGERWCKPVTPTIAERTLGQRDARQLVGPARGGRRRKQGGRSTRG